MNVLMKEVFVVTMILTYQYLRFTRQFFTINELTQSYIDKL